MRREQLLVSVRGFLFVSARARARARVLLVEEGPPLAKVSPKPLDVPGSKINLRRHGYQIL